MTPGLCCAAGLRSLMDSVVGFRSTAAANTALRLDVHRVFARAAHRRGRFRSDARYHRLPKRLVDDYVVMTTVLGTGMNSEENGPVVLAVGRNDGVRYAVKRFGIRGLSASAISRLHSEVEIFAQMDHPHVCRLCAIYEEEDVLSLVMECLEGGQLLERVTARRPLAESDAAEAAYQMVLAVNYLHSEGVAHRDIKLDNFLYDKIDSDHLKLIDFGLSTTWKSNDAKMNLSCGTLAYVAPDVLRKSYTSKCDMWSLGVTVFVTLAGYMPFSGPAEAQMRRIASGDYRVKPEQWGKVSLAAFDFVGGLLVVEPERRMTAKQALGHRWLSRRGHGAVPGEVPAGPAPARAEAPRSRPEDGRARGHSSGKDKEVQDLLSSLGMTCLEPIRYLELLAGMGTARIHLRDHLVSKTFQRFDEDALGTAKVGGTRDIDIAPR